MLKGILIGIAGALVGAGLIYLWFGWMFYRAMTGGD